MNIIKGGLASITTELQVPPAGLKTSSKRSFVITDLKRLTVTIGVPLWHCLGGSIGYNCRTQNAILLRLSGRAPRSPAAAMSFLAHGVVQAPSASRLATLAPIDYGVRTTDSVQQWWPEAASKAKLAPPRGDAWPLA
jgi:hypothetical protein